MFWGRAAIAALVGLMAVGPLFAQNAAPSNHPSPTTGAVLTHRVNPPEAPSPEPNPENQTVNLIVPVGTPLEVALVRETRVEKVGQMVKGKIVEPVYAFDKVVVPVGAVVDGKIDRIDSVSAGKRTEAALNADFTPSRKVHVVFDRLSLPGGKSIPIQTDVTLGSGQVLQLVTAGGNSSEKNAPKDAASQKVEQAKQEARQEWRQAMSEVKSPGKIHKFVRYAEAQLPIHAQYLDAGTIYSAELKNALDFGTEPLTPAMAESITETPPDGTVVRARLLTPLSSATTRKGAEVEAIVSQPEFDGSRLVVPQGSLLKGAVLQVEPARPPGRNGKLRIVYHELDLPGGVQKKVEALLAGVQADRSANMTLDSEGGAEAAAPNSRFLTTGITIGLAGFAFIGDSGGGDLVHSSAGGAAGFKLIGIAVGLATRSQVFGMAMGAFGSARSIYSNFIARGHDVVFPKNTVMEVGIATRQPMPAEAPAQTPGRGKSTGAEAFHDTHAE
ncbi:MAG TPA: hypothetical protein VMU43_02700 [Candidatus Acidoferrum sp.]|nr:hypothetical protein [Candidatus Acidoferrum sp.]